MSAIILPAVGYATEQATILRWLKAIGQPLQADEPLLELAAEKTVQVVGSPQGGLLLAIYAPPGAVVEQGQPLGWIGAAGEKPPALPIRIVGWEEAIAPPPAGFQPSPGSAPDTGHGAHAIPAALSAPDSIARPDREVLRAQLRQVTAQRMAHGWQAPKVDLFAEVDFTRVQEHRATLKQQGEEAPSYNVYIAHAAAQAVQAFPHLNLHWVDGKAVPVDGVHVGMAVALGDNLVTVSLRNLAGAGLGEIQRRFKGLIKKALAMNLRPDELYGSSLTITNLGEWDITQFAALLNPPELFILAIGKIEERACVRAGQVVAVPQCTFCLSFDHRGVDGAPASRLLQRIKHILERYPEEPVPQRV